MFHAPEGGKIIIHCVMHCKDMEMLPRMCVKNGAQQICQQLVKQCIQAENVIVNQPVSVVSFMDDDDDVIHKNVYVMAKDGQTYKCNRVIMALPPNVLREIEFSPPLNPAKKYFLNSTSMGCTLRHSGLVCLFSEQKKMIAKSAHNARKCRFMKQICDFMRQISHFMKQIGHFLKQIGHFIKKIGLLKKQIGHFMRQIGHFMKKIGHFMKQIGLFMKQIGLL